jgi:hypothetical protein
MPIHTLALEGYKDYGHMIDDGREPHSFIFSLKKGVEAPQ